MAKTKFPVFLVMPKVMMHREDGLYEELSQMCWTPFGPLWKSRTEAEAFAQQHIDKIQGANYIGVFTNQLAGSTFDFEKLPEAHQRELQKLLKFKEKSEWKQAFKMYRSTESKLLRRLLELLEIVPYRILETQVSQKQFDELTEAISHFNGFVDETNDAEEDEDEDEDIFEDEEDSEMKYLRPVGLAFGLQRCPEDCIHPEQEFVENNESQAGDSGIFW